MPHRDRGGGRGGGRGLTLAGLLPWRPLLVASATLVTLTTVGLTLAFERALGHRARA